MRPTIIFQTERLLVRRYVLEDADHFFTLNSHQDIVRFIRPPKTREESDLFLKLNIEACQETPLYGRWAAENRLTGQFVGSFAVIQVDGTSNMQLGYALLPECWGLGYATELTLAGLEYIFTRTPLPFIYAYTEKPNLASQKVLLKAGFVQQGTRWEGEKEIVEFFYPGGRFEKKGATEISNKGIVREG